MGGEFNTVEFGEKYGTKSQFAATRLVYHFWKTKANSSDQLLCTK